MATATYHSKGHTVRWEAGRRPHETILACQECRWGREVQSASMAALAVSRRHSLDTILVIS